MRRQMRAVGKFADRFAASRAHGCIDGPGTVMRAVRRDAPARQDASKATRKSPARLLRVVPLTVTDLPASRADDVWSSAQQRRMTQPPIRRADPKAHRRAA